MKPNILIIVIDSLRADKFYGDNKTSKTPNIDSLIKRGIYFNQAISSSDGTFVSLGSLFSALYPFKTGVSWFNFNSKVTKYFDAFKKHDYTVCATVPDLPFWISLTSEFNEKDICKGLPYLRLFEGMGEKIIERLQSNPKEPWIYYMHIMDLHVHLPVPKDFDQEKYGKDEYERRISAIDYWIGKILQKVDLDKTLLVLTADHGEYAHDLTLHAEYIPSIQQFFRKAKQSLPKFLEPMGIKLFIFIRETIKQIRLTRSKRILSPDEMRTLIERGKGYLYDDVLRIPLLFAGYGVTSSMVISQQVRQIDIFPTVAELIGLVSTEKVQGQSLVPLFSGRKLDEQPAYVEGISSIHESTLGNVIGLRTPEYKYYRSRTDPAKNITLFDLKNDPQEKNNIASTRQDIVEKMEKTLKQILDENKDPSTSVKIELSKEEVDAAKQVLRDLGYL